MDLKFLLMLFTLVISYSVAFNIYADSLVIARKSLHHRVERFANASDDPEFEHLPHIPKIHSIRIESNVTNRYARTKVTSKVKNVDTRAQEAVFAVILPEKAFVSKFIMSIDDKDYEAYVKEKAQAKQIYNHAVTRGLSAAHITESARDSNRFTVSVNIAPSSKATFDLTYEQLLERQDNKYELVINIHPKQPVKDLYVDVHIEECLPLTFVHAPPIRSGNDIRDVSGDLDPRATFEIINKTAAHITFQPTIQRQKEIAKLLQTDVMEGLSGQFVVQYDVERNPNGGEVLLEDGYFAHFFAPPQIEPLPKTIIFVLDTSGSMYSTKIIQLKEAMNKIFQELRSSDKFSLIVFNSNVKVLNIETEGYTKYPSQDIHWGYIKGTHEDINALTFPNSNEVTQGNIAKANAIINKLEAHGGTNIADALKVALHLVNLQYGNPSNPQPLIVFLTDGDATVGVRNPEKIIRAVSEQNIYKTPIYCLSFGNDANRNLLQKLSLNNQGFSRHIYEGADASLQLEDFYSHISSPIMNNITFRYVSDAKDITKTTFPILFNGSEIIVAGKLDKEFPTLPTVTAQGAHGLIDFVPEVKKPVTKLERLWAYMTIQQLLKDRETVKNKTAIEQKALDIALKYSFVTAVSSLVVVKPNSTNNVNLERSDQDNKDYHFDKATPRLGLQVGNSLPRYTSHSSNANSFSTNTVKLQGSNWDNEDQFNKAIPRWSLRVGGGSHVPRPTFYSSNIDRFPTDYTISSSTTNRPQSTPKINTIEELIQKLPWLNDTLENNVLHTEKGNYQIGINEHSPGDIVCPVTPTNSTGYCKHLHECTMVFKFLTSIQIFEQYRCELNGFAAVCCPPKKNNASSI